MYDISAAFDASIEAAAANRPSVLFIEPEDPRVLEAAFALPRFARPVFLASRDAVAATIRRDLAGVDEARVDFLLGESAFCPVASRPDLQAEFARAMLDLPAAKRIAADAAEAARLAATNAGFGIMAAALGHVDVVVGGAAHAPRDYFRPLVKVLSNVTVPCEVGVVVLPDSHPEGLYPHNVVVLGDVGVNATVTPEILAATAVGTCAVARDLLPESLLPRIDGAMVSYSNRGADEGPGPELVARAAELVPAILAARVERGERYRSIAIDSGIKISVALSAKSARMYRRGEDADFKGHNVIIAPNLDTGNLLFHLFGTMYPDARRFVSVFGIRFRGVDLPMDVEPADAALAVKATLLRLHRSGTWKRTPRDTFFPRPRILSINPGSTSTKIAVYEGEEEILTRELQHSAEELAPYEDKRITAQFAFRKAAIETFLADAGFSVADLDAVSARGGMLAPIGHGTYAVNARMLEDLAAEGGAEHASNLGAPIADALTAGTGKPAFIVDPVVVDEMEARAKITGMKRLPRRPVSHALNQIAVCHRYARSKGTFYERLNLIVCHMGGGVSVGAHRRGRYVDVNNALDGEGPFTPQRSGSLPVGDLIRLCFSGKATKEELLKLNKGRGGMIDLLGTADFREIEEKAQAGEQPYADVFEAFCYQISKWICSLLPAFDGEPVDAVILTGGMARAKPLVAYVRARAAAVAGDFAVFPGENEMAALAQGALRVLSGREPAREYAPPNRAGGR